MTSITTLVLLLQRADLVSTSFVALMILKTLGSGYLQVVLIMNTDVGHDTNIINDENMIGILTIDFTTIKSIKNVYVTGSVCWAVFFQQ